MSELKARHIVDVYDSYYAENPFGERSQVYLKSEADKVIADLEESHKMEVEQLLMEIVELKARIAYLEALNHELKEERRWRKCIDEMPNEKMEGKDFIVSNGFYSVVCEWRGYWNNEPFCGDKNYDEVKYWMPLPSAPEDADK